MRGRLALASLALVGLAGFFWPMLMSGFQEVPGGLGDTRFNNAILEHWWQVLCRGGDWRTVPMFHPAPGTLAYSDTLLLLVPFYAAARAAGLGAYHALPAAVAALLLLAYLSAAWLFRRLLGLPAWIAALAAFLHAFAALRLVHYGHIQLFASLPVPGLLGLAVLYTRQVEAGRWGIGPGLGLAVGLAVLLLTSFYVGWFTLVFLAVAGLALVAQAVPARLAPRPLLSLALLGLTFLVAVQPVLSLYLPRVAELGTRPWAVVAPTLPAPVDFVNVGSHNWVWGGAVEVLVPAGRPLEWELTYGLPPALMLLFLVTAATLVLFPRRDWLGGANAQPGARHARALAVAVLAAWLLMLAVGDVSLWRHVHAWIPGAAAIRAVFRFQAVLLPGVAAVAAFGLAGLWRAATAPRPRALVGLFAAFLVIEQVDTRHATFDGRREARRLAAWPAPPAECARFLLLAGSAPFRHRDVLQLDAVMLALRTGLPTLNGYSGDAPRGWALRDPRAPDYLAHAVHWAAVRDVTAGLCSFDAARRTWHVGRPRPPDLEGVNLITVVARSLDEGLGLLVTGFHAPEADGRWTDGHGRIVITPAAAARALHIDGIHGGPTRGPVRVRVNGRPRFDQALPPGRFAIALPADDPVETIEIESETFVPKVWKINDDARRLGVVVSRVLLGAAAR